MYSIQYIYFVNKCFVARGVVDFFQRGLNHRWSSFPCHFSSWTAEGGEGTSKCQPCSLPIYPGYRDTHHRMTLVQKRIFFLFK